MITNIFIWDNFNHYFVDAHGQYFLNEKPVFSFGYELITYHKDTQSGITIDGQAINLNPQQCEEIENFITQKREEVGILKHCVDINGKYLGFISIDDQSVFQSVSQTPLTADDNWIWDFDKQEWFKAYYFDAEGKLVDAKSPDAVGYTKTPMPNSILSFKWDSEQEKWIANYTEEEFLKYKTTEAAGILCVLIMTTGSNTDIRELANTMDSFFGDNFKYQMTKASINQIYSSNTSIDVFKTASAAKDILLLTSL